ncbi:MAG TPA: hypothetical protein VEB21_01145 [Terriglobales bacterium]|nr:hypothetical protein [Terriglobales bacterium]
MVIGDSWPKRRCDAVRYHCGDCIEKAIALPPVKETAELVRQSPTLSYPPDRSSFSAHIAG